MTVAREQVRRALRAAVLRSQTLFAPGARLVVAFSGGQDSTCLLHALASSQHHGFEIVAAHVDHALRADSAQDAERAVALAAGLGVRAVARRIEVAAYRRGVRGWSVQQAARAARYHALAAVVDEVGAGGLLVAHTADDQVETVLLNLLRGAGLAGLSGMRAEERLDPRGLGPCPAELAQPPAPVHLARPLLRVPRATTRAYCAELGLGVVDDPSNQSPAYTRNRVRLELLPALERFNPAIRTVLARTADLAAEDAAALDAVVERLHAELARAEDAERLEYDLSAWQAQPRGLQRRLLRHALGTLLGGLADVPAGALEDALDGLASGRPGQAYHLPYGVELRRHRATFALHVHGAAMPKRGPKNGDSGHSRV